MNDKKIVEVAGLLLHSGANQLEMGLFERQEFSRREPDRFLESPGGLAQFAVQLPGGAEIGSQGEVIGMGSLRWPENFDGPIDFAEPNVEGAKVRQIIGAELLLSRARLQLVRLLAIASP